MKAALLVLITLTLILPPLTTAQETTEIRLANGRTLTIDNALTLTAELPDDYYIIHVPTQITEDTYTRLTAIIPLHGYLHPNAYLTTTNGNTLLTLHNQGLLDAAWKFQDATNLNAELVRDEELTLIAELLPACDAEQLLTQLPTLGYTPLDQPSADYLTLKGNGLRTKELITAPCIAHLEPYPELTTHNNEVDPIVGIPSTYINFGLYGLGQLIAVGDTGLDTGTNAPGMHPDFYGRITALIDLAPLSATCAVWNCSTNPNDTFGHGTAVAGIALGNGLQSGANPATHSYLGTYAGAAPEANLVFLAIGDDNGSIAVYPPFPLNNKYYPFALQYGAYIHTNSWGDGSGLVNGNYNSISRQTDVFTNGNRTSLIIYGAGNQGPALNTVAPPATAKNIISVGSSKKNPINNISGFSSRGYTDDGRVKPDLVVPGESIITTRSSFGLSNPTPYYTNVTGTSAAAPLVAGGAALIREYYQTQRDTPAPTAALIKATLINGAETMGMTMPNEHMGWGRMNLTKSLPHDSKELFFADEAPTGIFAPTFAAYNLSVDGAKPLDVTLVWTDYAPASSNNPIPSLVSNLNLEVTDPNNVVYHGNDFTAPYDDTTDVVNNVERVVIPTPASGTYHFKVKAANTPMGAQKFALVAMYKKLPTLDDCLPGNVNSATQTTSVLKVNNQDGGPTGTVTVPVNAPLTLSIDAPPAGPSNALYVVYAILGTPSVSMMTTIPGVGTTCFPTPLTGGAPLTLFNTVGAPELLGTPAIPSTPAPYSITFPGGVSLPVTVTLQGFIFDNGSSNPSIGASVTNAVTLHVV